MNTLVYTDERTTALGSSPPNLMTMATGSPVVFLTISPHPEVKIKSIVRDPTQPNGKNHFKRMPYKLTSWKDQYDYCIKYFKTVHMPYYSDGSVIIGTWEKNASGLIHLHMIVYDKQFKLNSKTTNPYTLADYQNYVLSHSETKRNLICANKNIKKDYMNNICYINKSIKDIFDYLDKDHDYKEPFFKNLPNYFTYSLAYQVPKINVVF